VAIRCTGEGQVNFMAEIEKRLTYVAFTLAPFIPEPAVDDDILDDVIVKDDSIVKDDVIVNDDSIVNDDVIVNDDSIVNDDANSIDDIVGDDAATTPVILSDEEIAALLRAPVLTPFSVYRPCYLVDTRSSIPTTHEDLVLGTGNPNTKLNGVFFSSPDGISTPPPPPPFSICSFIHLIRTKSLMLFIKPHYPLLF
jgi:hypothetical protein